MKERYVKVNACSFKLQCFDVGFFGHVSSQEVHDLLFNWQFRWQLCRFSKFHLAVHLRLLCFVSLMFTVALGMYSTVHMLHPINCSITKKISIYLV